MPKFRVEATITHIQTFSWVVRAKDEDAAADKAEKVLSKIEAASDPQGIMVNLDEFEDDGTNIESSEVSSVDEDED